MKISRKKLVLIIIASCVGLPLLAAFVYLVCFNLQFSVYHDDQYQFSIRYPTSWKVVVHPRANVAVMFLRPKETAFDMMQENFNVTVQPLPKDIYTLDDFSNRIKGQMISVFGTSTKFVLYKQVHWGWRKGYELAIEAPRPDNLIMINAWVMRDKESYILTFLGSIDRYPQDKLVVREMIRSLKLPD
jgi:hypothetical protein